MGNRIRKVLALCLAAVMLLTGCRYMKGFGGGMSVIRFEDMEYVRPELSAYQSLVEECCALAEAGEDFRTLEKKLWELFTAYNDYYTNYSLADIHYCMDQTDLYWSDEYDYCLENASQIDAGLDQLYYALADSVFREKLEEQDYFGEDFFAEYEGESLWDDTFTGLMEEETGLITRYYDLSAQMLGVSYGTAEYDSLAEQVCALYVELIEKRQEIAACAGYEDYPHFAYDFYYARDYTPEQEAAYTEQIRQELVPLYRYVCSYGVEELELYYSSEEDTFAYVQGIAQAMGGMVEEAFRLMADGGLYDISYGENKYDASFEVYLTNYDEPFVFLNPEGSDYDKLTFSHEFGHFCNDYASYGSAVGIDVAEIFSQGMEYLGLCYEDGGESLEMLSMVGSLCVYVEQAAYASFERQAYGLTGEDLSVEGLCDLFSQVASDFGFDVWGVDSRDFATVPHFFTNPMYIFSYVVSNDAAMQLYQLEKQETGAGLQKYQENLDTQEGYFLAFLESAGLESPFAEGRIQTVRETLENILT